MFQRIVVAYDGDAIANRALDKAIALAEDTRAEIYLISVYSDHDIQSWRLHDTEYPANASELFHPDSNSFLEAEEVYVSLFLSKPADRVAQAGIPVHNVVTKGKPHTAIVEHAKAICADLIITGTHNRGAAAKMLLGSVSEELIRHAPCPVMVVGE